MAASMRDTISHADSSSGHRGKVVDAAALSSSNRSTSLTATTTTTAKSSSVATEQQQVVTNNNFEYDDNEWDIGIGDLIIDLDADIEKTNENNNSTSAILAPTSGSTAGGNLVMASTGANTGGSAGSGSSGNNSSSGSGKSTTGKMAIEHSATVDKGLKMKIKRTKPGTKTSEAKHEIVKSNELNGNASECLNSGSGSNNNSGNSGGSNSSSGGSNSGLSGGNSGSASASANSTSGSNSNSDSSTKSGTGTSAGGSGSVGGGSGGKHQSNNSHSQSGSGSGVGGNNSSSLNAQGSAQNLVNNSVSGSNSACSSSGSGSVNSTTSVANKRGSSSHRRDKANRDKHSSSSSSSGSSGSLNNDKQQSPKPLMNSNSSSSNQGSGTGLNSSANNLGLGNGSSNSNSSSSSSTSSSSGSANNTNNANNSNSSDVNGLIRSSVGGQSQQQSRSVFPASTGPGPPSLNLNATNSLTGNSGSVPSASSPLTGAGSSSTSVKNEPNSSASLCSSVGGVVGLGGKIGTSSTANSGNGSLLSSSSNMSGLFGSSQSGSNLSNSGLMDDQSRISPPPTKKIKIDPKDMIDVCVGTSVGTITEPDCLGPCEPGTSVTLEGIVWHETEGGVLVVNVTWRGKTYVGTLLDCTRHDWAPPRFCDSPTSDLDARTPKGRGKRGRAAAAAAAAATTPGNDLSNFTETRSSVHSKLRNGGAKGRRGTTTSSTSGSNNQSTNAQGNNGGNGNSTSSGTSSPTPFIQPRQEPSNKRKSRSGEDDPVVAPPAGKKSKTSSSNSSNSTSCVPASPVNTNSPPPSPVLLECPEPNCSKKYKHINGLKYHQSHAHGSSADDDDTKDVTSMSENDESNIEAPSPATPVKSPPEKTLLETPQKKDSDMTSAVSGTISELASQPSTPKSRPSSPPTPLSQTSNSILVQQPPPEIIPTPPAIDSKNVVKPGVLRFGPQDEFTAFNKTSSSSAASTPSPLSATTAASIRPQPLVQSMSTDQYQQLPHQNLPHTANNAGNGGGIQTPLQANQIPSPNQKLPQFKVKPTAALMPTDDKKQQVKPPGYNGKKKNRKSPAGSPHPQPTEIPQSQYNTSGTPANDSISGGREDVQSPAYSDISDDAAPVMLDGDIGNGNGTNGSGNSMDKSKAQGDKKTDDRSVSIVGGNNSVGNSGIPGGNQPPQSLPPTHTIPPQYGMYPFYGQPSPYLVPPTAVAAAVASAGGNGPSAPSVQQQQHQQSNPQSQSLPLDKSKVSSSDLHQHSLIDKNQQDNKEKERKEMLVQASADYSTQKVLPPPPPPHYYAPQYGYMQGYPYNLESPYGAVPMVPDDKLKDDQRLKESPSPADHSNKPSPLQQQQPIPNPIQVPQPAKIKTEPGSGLKDKHQQNENHQILKESIEIKNQMNPYMYSRQPPPTSQHQQIQQQQQPNHPHHIQHHHPPTPQMPHQQPGSGPIHHPQSIQSPQSHLQQVQQQQREEEIRRYYLYPDQRRSKDQSQIDQSQTPQPSQKTSSQPKAQPSPGLKSHSKDKLSIDDKKEKEIKQEGVKPTMETQGPPPPPTSQYAYIHPGYMQSPAGHYSAIPFDPNHPMYRSMLMHSPYGGNPYIHPQLPRYHAPEDLSRPPQGPAKALDILQHHANQYYTSHKIHELQERALKSPTPKTSVASASPSQTNSSLVVGGGQQPGSGGGGPNVHGSSALPPGSGPPGGPVGAGNTTSGGGPPGSQQTLSATGQQAPPGSGGVGKQAPGNGDGKDSRSPPPQRHVHTHHHTHVGLGYPILASQYPATYGAAAVLASQQAAAVTVINPYPPK